MTAKLVFLGLLAFNCAADELARTPTKETPTNQPASAIALASDCDARLAAAAATGAGAGAGAAKSARDLHWYDRLFYRNWTWRRYPNGNPYYQPFNRSQAMLLKYLGVRMNTRTLALPNVATLAERWNALCDLEIQTYGRDPKTLLYWPDIYVGDNGLRIFVRAGHPPPSQARRFVVYEFEIVGFDQTGREILRPKQHSTPLKSLAHERLNSADYHFAIAQGYFPIFGETRNIGRLFRFDSLMRRATLTYELMLIHDLEHLGGILDQPELTRLLRELSEEYSPARSITNHVMSYVTEYLNAFTPSAEDWMRQLIADFKLPFSLGVSGEVDSATLESFLKSLAPEKLKALLGEIDSWYPNHRRPFGGSLRTAEWNSFNRNPLDRSYLSMSPLDLESAIKPLTTFLIQMHAHLATTPGGWMALVDSNRPPARGSPYYTILCSHEHPFDDQLCGPPVP